MEDRKCCRQSQKEGCHVKMAARVLPPPARLRQKLRLRMRHHPYSYQADLRQKDAHVPYPPVSISNRRLILSATSRHNASHSRPHNQLTRLPQPTQRARARSARYALHTIQSLKRTDSTHKELVDPSLSLVKATKSPPSRTWVPRKTKNASTSPTTISPPSPISRSARGCKRCSARGIGYRRLRRQWRGAYLC